MTTNNFEDFIATAIFPITVTGGQSWEEFGIFDGSNHFEDANGTKFEQAFSGSAQDFSIDGTITFQTIEEMEKEGWLD